MFISGLKSLVTQKEVSIQQANNNKNNNNRKLGYKRNNNQSWPGIL